MRKAGKVLFCFFRGACSGGFLGSGALRGGLGSTCHHADLFEQLRLAAQGHLGDLEILRRPVVESLQGGILLARGLLRRGMAVRGTLIVALTSNFPPAHLFSS